jgi:hypothetical protein
MIRCPHCSGQLEIVAAGVGPAGIYPPSFVLDLSEYGSPSAVIARLRELRPKP